MEECDGDVQWRVWDSLRPCLCLLLKVGILLWILMESFSSNSVLSFLTRPFTFSKKVNFYRKEQKLFFFASLLSSTLYTESKSKHQLDQGISEGSYDECSYDTFMWAVHPISLLL